MAQIRYHNYRRPLASLDENLRFMGAHTPGVFCGWDILNPHAGNTVRLLHTTSGVRRTSLGGVQSNPMGCVVSRQGVFVYEDDYVEANVDFNATGNWRIDTLVMAHSFIDSDGGAAAQYSVIKGADNAPGLAPQFLSRAAVSNPATQVIIGYIWVPAGAIDHSGTKWQRLDPALPGGNYAFQKEHQSSNVPAALGAVPTDTDFNFLVQSGMLWVYNCLNAPTVSSNEWFAIIMSRGNYITQFAMQQGSGKAYVRGSIDKGLNWQPWASLNNVDINADITNLSNIIGNRQYTENNYIADVETLTLSLDKLDMQVKDLNDLYNAAAVNISNLSAAIGNRVYTTNNVIADGETLTQSLDKLDIAIGSRSYSQNNVIADGENIAESLEKIDIALREKLLIVNVPDWNMDTTGGIVALVPGISPDRITTISGMVISDPNFAGSGLVAYFNICGYASTDGVAANSDVALGEIQAGGGGTNVILRRKEGTVFDGANFDSVGGYVRVKLYVKYI